MFVLVNCIARLGRLVALFLVILICTKSFFSKLKMFILSIKGLYMPHPCMLSTITELSSSLHFLFQYNIK